MCLHREACDDSSMLKWIPLWHALWGHVRSLSRGGPRHIVSVMPVLCCAVLQDAFAPIFTLLFHKWLLSLPFRWDDETADRLSLLLCGALRLFWSDVQLNTHTYAPIYSHVYAALRMVSGVLARCDGVVVPSRGAAAAITTTQPEVFNAMPTRVRLDYTSLVFRFYLHYSPTFGGGVLDLFESLPVLDVFEAPPAGDKPSPSLNACYFVTELVQHLRDIRNPAALLQYLTAMRSLSTLPKHWIDDSTWNTLASGLQPFLSPGGTTPCPHCTVYCACITRLGVNAGPLFPTREVRHAAKQTIDELIPSGRTVRAIVRIVFRLLHPYYWPASFLNWMLSKCGRSPCCVLCRRCARPPSVCVCVCVCVCVWATSTVCLRSASSCVAVCAVACSAGPFASHVVGSAVHTAVNTLVKPLVPEVSPPWMCHVVVGCKQRGVTHVHATCIAVLVKRCPVPTVG